MIEHIRLHALDKANIVDDFSMMRQEITQPGSALTMLLKWSIGPQEFFGSLQEGKSLVLHEFGRGGFAVQFGKQRLMIEKFKLARTAGHEHVDHSLRSCLSHWVRRGIVCRTASAQHGTQRHGADAYAALAEKMSSCFELELIFLHRLSSLL